MKNLTIKAKLILLFIVIKVIPLLLIAYIAYEGAVKLDNYIQKSTRYLFNQNKEIIINTASKSIEDSIKNLDKKSQISLERLTYEVANNVAEFLYERDKDILFLSKIDLNQKFINSFYESKKKNIILHEDYFYEDSTNSWKSEALPQKKERENKKADLVDNRREFSYIDPIDFKTKSIPIYKEISYFDLKGKELYKVSSINENLLDVSKKQNTFINSEDYFTKIQKLKKGEIYVSDVIGKSLPTKIIGTFTKEKAKKANIEFEPEKYAYAGKENPVGKHFDGIVRFITPVYKNNKKVAYVSMALDHIHLMQFTDTFHPTKLEPRQSIADASDGNYAFMWDYEGRNISHVRDYFITGFDEKTGKRTMPWLSLDIAKKYEQSNQEINEFLKTYPTFEEQSLKKKPNIKQLKDSGFVGLDCRYLNFAPQCQGWMQVTKNGGYGSFVIYWSKVWKLTTAATIPYYTGKYAESKRGFGFITIGANVDEFHAAANETKRNVQKILKEQTNSMSQIVKQNTVQVKEYISKLINELSIVTLLMIVLIIAVALWMSNYITRKISNLLNATKRFSKKEFDYQIEVTSNDEIGNLEKSFNKMATQIKVLIEEQKELNEHLEEKVNDKTKELVKINQTLEEQIEQRTIYLKETLEKAKKADEAKSIFLANMSHEIRTPLNAIIGFSNVLTKNTNLDTQVIKQVKIIHTSANSLLSIINDILDISKIESGNFELSIEDIDINYISENVVELFSKRATEKQLRLIFNLDPTVPVCVKSDGVRVRQVLSNLLSNAIKFTPEKGSVTFNIFVLKKEQRKVSLRFEVIDNGIGIPEERLNSVFEPFIQVDHQSNRKFEGTGLGLSICRHIIETMDSKIYVSSEVGQGTKFWFDLSFDTCDKLVYENKKFIDKLNFRVTDTNNNLYNHIKRYLDIFGRINIKGEKEEILIHSYSDEKSLNEIREKYKNTPKLILLEYEIDSQKLEIVPNEHILSLPFYASKVNDSIQELLIKNNKEIDIEDDIKEKSFSGNILVAEDNSANQELISYILDSLGVNYELKENGKEVLEAFKENKYDLVLMDINMPIMDGIDAFKLIRKYEEENNLEETAIIALTANAIKGDKEKFLELGMNDYISKPLNNDELVKIFEKYLEPKALAIKEKIQTPKIEEVKNYDSLQVDTNKVVEKLGISETIANLVVSKFKEEIKKDIIEFEKIVKTKDIEEIASKAHYIKNTCLNVCLDEVCEYLQVLEEKKIKECDLEEYFKGFKSQISRYL